MSLKEYFTNSGKAFNDPVILKAGEYKISPLFPDVPKEKRAISGAIVTIDAIGGLSYFVAENGTVLMNHQDNDKMKPSVFRLEKPFSY